MNRRQFAQSVLLGAATASGVGLAGHARVAAAQKSNQAPAQKSALIIDGLSPSGLNERYLGMLKQAGVAAWHKTLFGLQSFSDVWEFADAHRERLRIVDKAADIDAARSEGRLALILGWQTATPIGDVSGQSAFGGYGNPTGATGLRAWYQLGLRVVNLTYNTVNAFAAGCLEPHLGLTRAGQRLVEEIHRMSILLDVGGHTGRQSSLEALAMSKGVPVICSHTNVAALCDNPRNTSDDVFEGIARTGGVIGVSAINDFVARRRKDKADKATAQVDLPVLLDHFDYLKKLVGADHIGLGPDFTEGNNTRIDPDSILIGREMASEQQPINYVKGFEDITQVQNLARGLAGRGWNQADIDKVMGLNWMRVYRRVWPGEKQ